MLFDNYIVHYGFPACIRSDQGANFESNLIYFVKQDCWGGDNHTQHLIIPWDMDRWKSLIKVSKVAKIRSRYNQVPHLTLNARHPSRKPEKSDRKTHVPTSVHSYNATIHDNTGFSPNFLKIWPLCKKTYLQDF